ncbi:Na+/H+ antiporter subunit E [Rhodobacteraceae bacterium HSP-20]|uniref:Na+/H+ antiporter subunit E n=1 Tax=Paragemmobacter amnigenus TaxID=2852097 RepID=A0ABS6J708_9RHOB|nr:Na+/H+ antiporter subunit E [Rhodobacter amnigenus]MBU9699536.1 Na+/H+ antiporter subunit E [Rhodobacter amnigenus]MBV4390763.1 Na+/H+ antiporter subunit E [Rhodobacter amnigenus]
MLRRLFPHPVLSLFLIVTWFLLVNDWKLGSLVMAAILATLIPLFTAPYWPGAPRVRNLPALLAYVALVVWDVILANIQVARIVLFMPPDRIRSAFIRVPVDLATPEAIAVLAGTITMTPGTVTADMSADGRVLLIHSLHAPDPDAIRDDIKSRYETRLKRIFG